jgi:hypothetical protein
MSGGLGHLGIYDGVPQIAAEADQWIPCQGFASLAGWSQVLDAKEYGGINSFLASDNNLGRNAF